MTESIAQPMTIDIALGIARSHGACAEALRWLKTQNDPETAWQTCDRPDWMIWLAARRGIDRRIIVRIACACARTALHVVPEGEDRPRLAIETAERWISGEATIGEVRAAADAADAAHAAADADRGLARLEANRKMCAIVRQHISFADIARAA